MAKVELADCVLNIGGDAGNQVPKTAITPAEIAILRAIHGEDSVHSLKPLDAAEVDLHEEMDRLQAFYGWKEENARLIQRVLPTVSNMPLTLRELRMPEEYFVALARAAPADEERALEEVEEPSAAKPSAKAGKKTPAVPAVPAADVFS